MFNRRKSAMPAGSTAQTFARLVRHAVVAAGLVGASTVALAQYDGLVWRCVQQRDAQYSVACMAIVGRDALQMFGGVQSMRVSVVRGRELRPVAEQGVDALLSELPWTVPLYAAPSDRSRVIEVLESALCGDIPCRIEYRDAGFLANQ